jgi:hypothetical protein
LVILNGQINKRKNTILVVSDVSMAIPEARWEENPTKTTTPEDMITKIKVKRVMAIESTTRVIRI